MSTGTIVYLIDDEAAVREGLAAVLGTYGFRVQTFASGEDFLALTAPAEGCVVADVRMPGMSGLDLLRRLAQRHAQLPVVLITGHGDVPMAVEALKAGACDFLEKPLDDVRLADAIRVAVQDAAAVRDDAAGQAELRRRRARLTSREAEVMDLVVEGFSNAAVAARLGISARTVEHYRSQVMLKMEASGLSHLVRMALSLDA